MTTERIALTPEQYWEAVERARVLARVVAEDPTDLDARLSLALLRRDGFDVEDPAWVLGFAPNAPAVAPATSTDPDAPTARYRAITGDEWTAKALSEARGYAAVGLVDRAIELLETVLHMQPENDLARSRLFELEMRRLAVASGTSPDETLRIRPR